MYSFEDLKKEVDNIDFSEKQLFDSDIVLFGAGVRCAFVYEK